MALDQGGLVLDDEVVGLALRAVTAVRVWLALSVMCLVPMSRIGSRVRFATDRVANGRRRLDRSGTGMPRGVLGGGLSDRPSVGDGQRRFSIWNSVGLKPLRNTFIAGGSWASSSRAPKPGLRAPAAWVNVSSFGECWKAAQRANRLRQAIHRTYTTAQAGRARAARGRGLRSPTTPPCRGPRLRRDTKRSPRSLCWKRQTMQKPPSSVTSKSMMLPRGVGIEDRAARGKWRGYRPQSLEGTVTFRYGYHEWKGPQAG